MNEKTSSPAWLTGYGRVTPMLWESHTQIDGDGFQRPFVLFTWFIACVKGVLRDWENCLCHCPSLKEDLWLLKLADSILPPSWFTYSLLVYLLPRYPLSVLGLLGGAGWRGGGGGGGFFWCCWYWVLLGLSPNVEQQIEQKNEEHLTSQKPLIFDKFQRESGRK